MFKPLFHPMRWRRTHGFGVHSPFAYRFITRVIAEAPVAYYAYHEIDGVCPRARRRGFNEIFAGLDFSVPEARLLLRVLCDINPRQVVEFGSGHEVTNVVVSRAVPRASHQRWAPTRQPQQGDERPIFFIVNNLAADEYEQAWEYIRQALPTRPGHPGAMVFMRNIHRFPLMARLWADILASATHGMAFYDIDLGIFVALPHLPRQDFFLLL